MNGGRIDEGRIDERAMKAVTEVFYVKTAFYDCISSILKVLIVFLRFIFFRTSVKRQVTSQAQDYFFTFHYLSFFCHFTHFQTNLVKIFIL